MTTITKLSKKAEDDSLTITRDRYRNEDDWMLVRRIASETMKAATDLPHYTRVGPVEVALSPKTGWTIENLIEFRVAAEKVRTELAARKARIISRSSLFSKALTRAMPNVTQKAKELEESTLSIPEKTIEKLMTRTQEVLDALNILIKRNLPT